MEANQLKAYSRTHKGSSTKYSSKGGSSKASGSNNPVVEFYFVVNELVLDERQPNFDQWGNPIPPNSQYGFTGEITGTVFRYQDGNVDHVPNMFWSRERWGDNGYIYDGNNSPLYGYSCGALFDCGSFLPCVVSDGVDPTVITNEAPMYFALHFAHHGGITRATNGSNKYVAGRSPSWLGTLVSENYRNQDERSPPSQGLGGDFWIIIGLMALTQRRRHASDAFHHWRHNRWNGRRQAGVSKFYAGH